MFRHLDKVKKLKKEDQKLRRLEALCLSRKTRNGTSPFLSRIIIRDPDNNWMLMSKPSRKKLRKRSFIKIEYIKWNLISHVNDKISFSRQSSTDILIIPPYIPYQSFSTSSNVQLNELDPYFRPFHAAYHEFLPA